MPSAIWGKKRGVKTRHGRRARRGRGGRTAVVLDEAEDDDDVPVTVDEADDDVEVDDLA